MPVVSFILEEDNLQAYLSPTLSQVGSSEQADHLLIWPLISGRARWISSAHRFVLSWHVTTMQNKTTCKKFQFWHYFDALLLFKIETESIICQILKFANNGRTSEILWWHFTSHRSGVLGHMSAGFFEWQIIFDLSYHQECFAILLQNCALSCRKCLCYLQMQIQVHGGPSLWSLQSLCV